MRLYLASTSPARRATLRQVGLEPIILDHSVNEEETVADASRQGPLTPVDIVQLLARAKAESAVGQVVDGLILGGDSMFEVGGHLYGKPHTAEVAKQRWELQRGQAGILHSGHWLCEVKNGQLVRGVGEATQATVRFAADMTDDEIDAYIQTGEPLKVAGAFTIDARGAAFIEGIEGDPYTVVGLSVVTLRRLVRSLGHEFTDLWV